VRTCKKELGDSYDKSAQEHRSLYVNEAFVAFFKARRDWARRATGYLSEFSSLRETVSYIQMFTSTTNSPAIFLLLYNSSSLTFLTHIIKESEKSVAEKASCETAPALLFTAKLIHIFNPFLPFNSILLAAGLPLKNFKLATYSTMSHVQDVPARFSAPAFLSVNDSLQELHAGKKNLEKMLVIKDDPQTSHAKMKGIEVCKTPSKEG